MSKQKYTHFNLMDTYCNPKQIDHQLCVGVMKGLLEEFTSRFCDVKAVAHRFQLLTSPFTIDIDSVPDNLQLELISLQCNEELRSKFLK